MAWPPFAGTSPKSVMSQAPDDWPMVERPDIVADIEHRLCGLAQEKSPVPAYYAGFVRGLVAGYWKAGCLSGEYFEAVTHRIDRIAQESRDGHHAAGVTSTETPSIAATALCEGRR